MGAGLACRSEAASGFEIFSVESSTISAPIVVGNGGLSEVSTDLLQSASAGAAVSWTLSDPTAVAYVERMVSNDARDAAASVYLLSISLGNSQGRNDSLLSAIEIWQALAGSGGNEIIVEADRYRGDRPGRRGDQALSQNWFSDESPSDGIPLAPGNSPGTLDMGNLVLGSGTLVDLIGDIPLIDFSDTGLVQSVPEPSSILLAAIGVFGLLRRHRDS